MQEASPNPLGRKVLWLLVGMLALLILWALIGRLDPKTHRKQGLFEVKALHLEPDVSVDEPLVTALLETLRACAMWHETPHLVVREASEPELADMLSD